jgi:hypothetical protein
MVNTEEAALCAVLTRPTFLRCTRSVLYGVEYGGRAAFDYVWPSPTAHLSLTAVGDADIAASAVGKKTLTVLLREQSATAATVTLPTTVYLLDEPERPSASAQASQQGSGVRVVTLEGEAETGSRDGAYATASVVGNTQLQVRTSASAPRALTVRIQVGRRTPYERTFEDVLPATRRAREPATLQFAWTVSNAAVIFMLCLPKEPRVVFGVVRVDNALAGVSGLPPRAYGYIANYYRVYKRMQQGVAHRATVTLPERFTLRPTSMDPTMCLERRDDGAVAAAACARGNQRQQWSDDGRGALRSGGGGCLQVQRDGTSVSAGPACEGDAMVRYDQKRRQLTWRDGRFCGGDGRGALRMRECGAKDVATYEAVPFV